MPESIEDILRRIVREELAAAARPPQPPYSTPHYPKPLQWPPHEDGTGFPPHWLHTVRD